MNIMLAMQVLPVMVAAMIHRGIAVNNAVLSYQNKGVYNSLVHLRENMNILIDI